MVYKVKCFGPSRSALSVHLTAQNFWRHLKGLPTLLNGVMESCNWKACKSQSADATTALLSLSAWLQSSATPGLNMCLGFWCAARQTELETPLSAAHAVSKDHQTRAAAQSKQTEEGGLFLLLISECLWSQTFLHLVPLEEKGKTSEDRNKRETI